MQDDLSDAVTALVDMGYTDARRVCIVGSSYGGYAALAGASFTPDLYQCAVSIAGVSHLPKLLAANKIKIPILLVHGEDDTVVEYEQSRLMHKAINKAKAIVQLIKLKDDDHYLRDGRTRIQALEATVEFVEQNIGARKGT